MDITPKMDITPILESIITIVFLLITSFVIPLVKSKVKEAKLKDIEHWVKIAVQAAEMIYKESGMGEKKKQEVLAFLEKKGYKLDFDEIDNLIESAVLELNRAS